MNNGLFCSVIIIITEINLVQFTKDWRFIAIRKIEHHTPFRFILEKRKMKWQYSWRKVFWPLFAQRRESTRLWNFWNPVFVSPRKKIYWILSSFQTVIKCILHFRFLSISFIKFYLFSAELIREHQSWKWFVNTTTKSY